MSKLCWIVGDGMEEFSFKRRPEGWLFAAPTPWPRRRYIVTDEQKAQLAKPLRWMRRLQMLVILVAAFFLTGLGENHSSLVEWLALGALMVAMLILSAIYVALAIRPLLAGLTPTTERISRSDRFATEATIYSKGRIITFLVISLVLFAVSLLRGFTSGWDSFAILGVVLFAAMSVYFVALFIAKQRTKGLA